MSWLVFFWYLGRHPELLEEGVGERFFARESTRAWVGVLRYGAAGLLGYLIAPAVALVILLAPPVFYAITSHGLDPQQAKQ